ncbi:MAG TPA: UvrD-helicase domain-containing protein [Solirubrobacteraceae bacterium]
MRAVSARALTDEQERAVERRQGSLLLAAGAGSGKTSVLVERFVRAVRVDGFSPGRILAITFTERAAGELRERVRSRLLELGAREAAREAQDATVCTFHSFCARLLRIHPLQAGVEPGFQILEESFADRLRTLAFGDALAGFLEGERAEAVDLVAAYGADSMRGMVLGAYAQLRSQGQAEPRLPVSGAQRQAGEPESESAQARLWEEPPPSQEVGAIGPEDALCARALIGELVERFGDAYAHRKRARAALDFDDLELLARDMLTRRADVREAWAMRFELLMVDEFQDTNPRQLEILSALDRDNLFTVGDELQSIYSFRHADVELFRERHRRLEERAASLALTANFRSRPAVIAAVDRIFATRLHARFTPLRTMRSSQENDAPIVELLLTDKRGWEEQPVDEELVGLPDATPWRQAEARLLAARIAELVASGQARAGEIAVLLRSLGDLPVYETALRRFGLRTLAGTGGFWSHQQVGDLLAWLRALTNPLDELALYSTLASPLVGLSSDGLALIARAARALADTHDGEEQASDGEGTAGEGGGTAGEGGGKAGGDGTARETRGGVWQAIRHPTAELCQALGPVDAARLSAFRELFAAERATAALRPIPELLRRAILATGYEAHVLALNWGERRLANVHKLIRLARVFEAREGRDTRRFLEHVDHIEGALGGREPDAPVVDAELDAVRLMSIHASKGLEFPVVCVADLGRDPNLRQSDLLVDGATGRLGLRLLRLGDPEAVPAFRYEELREERRGAQEEEEDRVLYVACTRAEDRLLLSGAVPFERWPAPKQGVAPIAWLAPALVPDAPSLAAAAERPGGALTVDLGDGLRVRCVFNAPPSLERVPLFEGGERAPRSTPTAAPTPLATASPPASSLSGSDQLVPNRPAAGPSVSAFRAAESPPSTPLSDPDSTMSYSSLAELERCGYRYYLERVLRLPERRLAGADEAGLEARARGTIVHALLEEIDFTRPSPPTVEDVALVAHSLGATVGKDAREEIATLIGGALEAEPARLLAAARRARAEHPFAFSLGGKEPLVTGFLDLIVEAPGGATLIVDYKSDRISQGDDLEALVVRDYGLQRLLYALAAIEHGAAEVEVAHWFLERPERWAIARFVARERNDLRERLLARIARMRAGGFAVTPEPHRGICLTCPGRGGLCSWGETRTMGARSTTLESD